MRRRYRSISIVALIFNCILHHAVLASPVFVPQILSEGTGRNIRHLLCVSRRTGETGICMFALTCAKANGTHLGTCIDSFYFGSCCKIDDAPDVSPQNNTIDIDGSPLLSKPQATIITTTTTTTTTTSTISTPLLESNDIPGNVDNQKLSTTQSTTGTSDAPSTYRTEATKAKPSKIATKKPVLTEFTTESIKLSTFQSVQNASHQRPLAASAATTVASAPTKIIQRPSVPDAKPVTSRPKPTATTLSISSSSSVNSVASTSAASSVMTTTSLHASLKPTSSSSSSSSASSTFALDSHNKTSKKPSSASPTERPVSSIGTTKPSFGTTFHRNVTTYLPSSSSSSSSSSTNKTTPTDATKPSVLFSSSTRFPPRNATTEIPISSASIDSHPTATIPTTTTLVPNKDHLTTKKASTTKKPSRITTKKPIFLTISKKPISASTAAPAVIATTTAATEALTTSTTEFVSKNTTSHSTSSVTTTVKFPTTVKPAVSPGHNVTISTATVATNSKKPVSTTFSSSSKKPLTTTTLTTTKRPYSTTVTKATTIKRPTSPSSKKNATSTVSSHPTSSAPSKVTSTVKKPVPSTLPPSPVTVGQSSSRITTARPTTPRTPTTSVETTTFSSTTVKSTVPSTVATDLRPLADFNSTSAGTTGKPTAQSPTPMPTSTSDRQNVTDTTPIAFNATTVSIKNTTQQTNVTEANATTPVPGIVTWTSVSGEVESSTKTSTNSSEAAETLETDWVPLTTPDGWIIIQSPTAEKPESDVESTVKPMTSSTQAPIATTKPITESTTPRATTTTSQPTTYLEQLSTVATVTAAPDFTGSTMAPINMSNFKEVCGRRLFPDARVVGGNDSTFGKWPWQISLRQWRTSTYLHKCGAALLNENWAITAAHCVQKVLPSDLLLRIGEYDLANEEEPYSFQERRVQIVASHPNFDPRTFEFDLALMRFYEPVLPFQPNVLPICVPDDDENYVGQTAYVTGWGRLYEDGPLPSVLQEVAVPVINNSLCEGMYRNAGYIEHIPHIFICAGWRNGGFDSCEGDSGGPLVIQRKRDKRWVLAGVISWGIGCAEPNQPGVYTRISEFREWINQILQF